MDSVIFSIGSIEIRWYSVLIAISIIFAYFLIINESKKFKIDADKIFNMIFWSIIIGIIGARIYYVLFNLSYYLDNLLEIIQVYKGGLAIQGGIIFGGSTLIIYCKKNKLKTLKMLDIAVVAVILGQAIGRWGNFFNSEAYGSAVSYQTLLNIKIIPKFIIDNMFIDGAYHLPMFYFESLWCFIGFFIMIIIRRFKYIKNGTLAAFYLMWYGLARFFIEIYRTDSLMFFNIKVAQIVSVLMVIIGIIILVVQYRKPKLEELYNEM